MFKIDGMCVCVSGMEMIERPIVYKRAIEMFAAIREVVGDEVLRPSLVTIHYSYGLFPYNL